ncbi:hypothetical protein MQ524_002474 [Salmonella enterica]|nr:hypothetical protein [Salmonella enterica]
MKHTMKIYTGSQEYRTYLKARFNKQNAGQSFEWEGWQQRQCRDGLLVGYRHPVVVGNADEVAMNAYQMADAMLRAREAS